MHGLSHHREGRRQGDRRVTIYACEGSGTGRETERGAWREVGTGTLTQRKSTRLALAEPVAVGAGATVGLFVHSASAGKGWPRRPECGHGEFGRSNRPMERLEPPPMPALTVSPPGRRRAQHLQREPPRLRGSVTYLPCKPT